MKENNDNTKSNPTNSVSDELHALSKIKDMSFFVRSTEKQLIVGTKPHHLLYILFYSVYFFLPLLLIGKQLKEYCVLLFFYYPLFVLLIWNISRTSKILIFDLQNKKLTIKNNNVLGALIRKKVKLDFNEIADFEVEYLLNRNKTKSFNQVYLIRENAKKELLIKLAAFGASKINGNKFVELVKLLILVK